MSSITPAWRDNWARSVRLFRSFLTEQTDPVGFYSLIAEDTVELMRKHMELDGRVVADFGGSSGYYSAEFRKHGATSVVIDASYDELRLHGTQDPCAIQALAEQSPLADASVDIAFSSNLLEHVPDLAAVSDQMARVVRPGGYVVLSYTAWLGPWGGHETSPWHYLGGHRAARRYQRRHGRPPKNVFGESMYAASVAEGLRWARNQPGFELVEERPRYLPPISRFLLRIPVLREFLTWNLWLVLRRKP
ncbi:class I SAM-dependent methyltransferase [Nocardioides sp. AE5]|uniref:class I SAM-dependent methyltransferase n=1 Tax=Nocardioides sp. AE5 TaxID=2962573 RepID=UPI002881CA4C|nr:class I SAM-dependent methyltransferase [Nocardioides sp. AE5]MDT0201316.1 class I SAM-dependent methyltransferase [Nocardioides sp. AE5]